MPHRVVSATAGDHAGIHQFLIAVFQRPSDNIFLASLDDPFYEPQDRLIIKRREQILAHVHLCRRVMHYGQLRLPVTGLAWLGTLPEFRGNGFARSLVRSAEQSMIEDGSVMGFLRTRVPYFFRSEGWAVCGRHCFARADIRDLLAHTAAVPLRRRARKITVRPWRQVELPGLMRIYRENTAWSVGPIERTESYWRWLLSRRDYDNIFVAINGADKFEWDDQNTPIIGYAITRDATIQELMVSHDHPQAAGPLLARACREAIEADDHAIDLWAPPSDALYDIFEAAGGPRYDHESLDGEVFMVKIFDPSAWLVSMRDEFHTRATAAGLQRPAELGLLVEGRKNLISVSARSVKIRPDRLGRSYLSCNRAELTRLLLGHVDVAEAIGQGRIEASTRIAEQTASALFPRLPLWRSMLDEIAR